MMTIMQNYQMKAAVVGAWMLACGAMALLVHVSSVAGWAALIGLGILPPLMFLRLWRPPVPSMSESIREVLK